MEQQVQDPPLALKGREQATSPANDRTPPNLLAIDFLPADGHHVIDVIQRKGIKNVLANPPKTHVWEVTALEKGGDPGHEGQYYTKRSKASQC